MLAAQHVPLERVEVPAPSEAFPRERGESSPLRPTAPGVFRHERALDGLRGVAVLAVMLFHFTMYEESTRPLYRSALRLLGAGWAGVDLFFALSGFLITGILLDTRDQPHFFRNFYARRALRILPLYYAVLAVVMVMLAVRLPASGTELRDLFGRQLWLWTYTSNIEGAIAGQWHFNAGGVYLDHFRSLAIEEQFYLVWPVVVLTLSRRALTASTLGIALTAALLRAVLTACGVAPTTVYSFTPCRLDALALGGLAAVVVREPAFRWLWLTRGAGLLALGQLAWLAWRQRGLPWLDSNVDVSGLSALAVLAASVLVELSVEPGGPLRSLFRSRPLVFLGKYSYATYVFHYMLWPRLERHLPAARLEAASGSELLGLVGHVMIGIAISVALAVLSFHLFERHFLALRRRFAYR